MEWKDCSSAVRPVVESVVEGVSSAVKEIFPDMPDCTWPRINEREGVAEDNGFAGDVGCGVFDGLAEYLSWSIEPQQPVDGYVARFDFIFAPRGEEFNRSVGRHEVPWVGASAGAGHGGRVREERLVEQRAMVHQPVRVILVMPDLTPRGIRA